MLFRRVARRDEPNQPGGKPNQRADPERSTPTVVQHNVGHERRRDCGTYANARENHAIGHAALLRGNPARDELIGRRVDHRFPDAEQQPGENQRGKRIAQGRRDRGGKRRENTPPDHATRQHAARAPFVGEPTCRGLEERVTQKKKCRQTTELHIAEVVVGFDARGGDAQVDAVEKGDGAQDEKPSDEQPPYAGCGGHALCARKSCTRRSAMIFSSPGCSWKEFMPKPSRPPPRTMAGLPLRNSFSASLELRETWRGSQ